MNTRGDIGLVKVYKSIRICIEVCDKRIFKYDQSIEMKYDLNNIFIFIRNMPKSTTRRRRNTTIADCAMCDDPILEDEEFRSCKTCNKYYHTKRTEDLDDCWLTNGGCCGLCIQCGTKRAKTPEYDKVYCKNCWRDTTCGLCSMNINDEADLGATDGIYGENEEEDELSEQEKKEHRTCPTCHDAYHVLCWRNVFRNAPACCYNA